MQTLDTDIVIVGGGVAGLFAALCAKRARPELGVTIATKHALRADAAPGDAVGQVAGDEAVKRRFMAAIEAGRWRNDQELVWRLANAAAVRLLEWREAGGAPGCLAQLVAGGVRPLEHHRALDLIPAADGGGVAAVLMLDTGSGKAVLVRAHAVLLATGCAVASCDGMAMALRAGLPLRDMDLVQFDGDAASSFNGGVAIASDGSTAMQGLYAAGDVAGGVHGAKRVAGNGLAGALVFGAAAGESMAAAANPSGGFADPDPAALAEAERRAFAPLGRRRADLASVRARLAETMSGDLGPRRDAEGLKRARHALNNLAASIAAMGVPDPQLQDNSDWQDRLDLENLVLVSHAIGVAAQADDWDAAKLHTTLVRAEDERLVAATEPVAFTRVRPGESLLPQAAE